MLSIGYHVIGGACGEFNVHVRLLEREDPGPAVGFVFVVDQSPLQLWEFDQVIETELFFIIILGLFLMDLVDGHLNNLGVHSEILYDILKLNPERLNKS